MHSLRQFHEEPPLCSNGCSGWACKQNSETTGYSKRTVAEHMLPAGEGATFPVLIIIKGNHTKNQGFNSLDLKLSPKVHADVIKIIIEHSD